jgi:tetratricopeptide (TPR) repeat protein
MYWWLRGHIVHGRRHMEAVLAHELPDPIRAKAELAAATAAFAMDDIEASRSWWVAAEAHAAGGDDPVTTANAVAGQGLAALALGDLRAAQDFFERAVPFADAGGARGEWTAALNQIWLGTVAMLVGDSAGAADHIAWGLASARRRGDRLTIYVALYNLSQSEVARGGHDVARGHLEEGTRLSMETGDLANLAYFLDALAVLEAADGRQARVPLLLGAAQAIREAIGSHGYGYYRPDPSAIVDAADQARQRLGTDRYDDALDMGRAMSPDEAARLALSERVRPT